MNVTTWDGKGDNVTSSFISYYFEPHLRTRINYVSRHGDGGEVPSRGNLSIFSSSEWPASKILSGKDICLK